MAMYAAEPGCSCAKTVQWKGKYPLTRCAEEMRGKRRWGPGVSSP